MDKIFDILLENFDIAYMLSINILTYIIIKAIDYPNSEIFNLGFGRGYSVYSIARRIKKITKRDINISILKKRDFDQACLIADNSKTKKLLNWIPMYNLDSIIRESYERIKVDLMF